MVRMAVADTSPLIHLAKAGALEEARSIVGVIAVVPAVWREAVESGEHKGAPDSAAIRRARTDGCLRTVSLDGAERKAAGILARRHRLGGGESEVLAVALRSQWILMDDGRARRVAEHLGFAPVSTISLPVLGRNLRLLERNQARALLSRLGKVVGVRADTLAEFESKIEEVE